jgi:hypothetical protein
MDWLALEYERLYDSKFIIYEGMQTYFIIIIIIITIIIIPIFVNMCVSVFNNILITMCSLSSFHCHIIFVLINSISVITVKILGGTIILYVHKLHEAKACRKDISVFLSVHISSPEAIRRILIKLNLRDSALKVCLPNFILVHVDARSLNRDLSIVSKSARRKICCNRSN